MAKNHSEPKRVFSVCVCAQVLSMSTGVPLRATGFHHLTLTDVTSEEEIKSWVCQVYPVCHSFHSSLYVYVCLLSSSSRHAGVSADLTFRPSIHLAALSAGLSDCLVGSFVNPKVLAGTFKFLSLFIMCSRPEKLLFCSRAILHQ